MKIICPTCARENRLADDELSGHTFSFLCESCEQLLSVKIVVEALSVVRTKQSEKQAATDEKNRVSTYIKEHMDELQLPVLPVLATKIRQAKENPNASINDVVDIVKTDQIIASKILALANSAMYGGLVEITSLKMAIIKLGLSATETLVQALENKRIYSSENRHMKSLLEQLWLHALGVAVTAQTMAQELKMEQAEEIFTAGLLHDFGYILFVQALMQAEGFKVDLSKMNVEEFMQLANKDHAALGAMYLSKVGLPRKLTTIVAHHEVIPAEESENRALHVVSLANLLCKKVGLSPRPDDSIRLELTESAQFLGFNDLRLADLEVKCEDLVGKVHRLLQ